MKKLLSIVCLSVATALVHGQGYIIYVGNVANIQTNTSTYYAQGAGNPVSGKTLSSNVAPGTYQFALLESVTFLTGGAANPGWHQVAAFGGGVLQGGQGPGPGGMTGPGGSSGVQIDAPAGTAENFLLVGWSSNLGSTWDSIKSQFGDGTINGSSWQDFGYFGQTAIGTATPFATAGAGDPFLFPSIFPNGSLTLYVVGTPEPSTMALTALGGLSLLALRRKK